MYVCMYVCMYVRTASVTGVCKLELLTRF
jgi:hypothetical protein